MTNQLYKIAICIFSQRGRGHITRALAYRNALARAGLIAQIELYLVGAINKPELWPEPDKVIQFDPNQVGNNKARQEFANTIGALGLDLLILDNQSALLQELINPQELQQVTDDNNTTRRNILHLEKYYREDRPKQVWMVQRYHPGLFWNKGAYQGFSLASVDRCYVIEFCNPYDNGWLDDYSINRPRSRAVKAGGTYQPYRSNLGSNGQGQDCHLPACIQAHHDHDHADKLDTELSFDNWLQSEEAQKLKGDYLTLYHANVPEQTLHHFDSLRLRNYLIDAHNKLIDDKYGVKLDYKEWQKHHGRLSFKVLNPVVNLPAKEDLPTREVARKFLCDKFSLSGNKPIALVVNRNDDINPTDANQFDQQIAALKRINPDYQIVELGNRTGQLVEDVAKYYIGADHIICASSYNSYWESLYLVKLGLMQPEQFSYVAITHTNNDQLWRLRQHYRGTITDAGYWKHNHWQDEADHAVNGADDIARFVGDLMQKEKTA